MEFLKHFRWHILIVLVAICGIAWIHSTRIIPQTEALSQLAAARVNFPAPDFALDALDDSRSASQDLRGKIVVVNFWATWCPPCRAEMSDLQAAFQDHAIDNVIVVAINNAEPETDVQQFVDEYRLTFPILLDHDLQVAQQFQVMALPTSFIIDREGIIRAVNIGGMDRAYIEAQLAKLGVTRR